MIYVLVEKPTGLNGTESNTDVYDLDEDHSMTIFFGIPSDLMDRLHQMEIIPETNPAAKPVYFQGKRLKTIVMMPE